MTYRPQNHVRIFLENQVRFFAFANNLTSTIHPLPLINDPSDPVFSENRPHEQVMIGSWEIGLYYHGEYYIFIVHHFSLYGAFFFDMFMMDATNNPILIDTGNRLIEQLRKVL